MSSNKPETRIKILEATWKLLEQRGGVGVRMSDIAKRAGVSRQAVYLHFATRIELMSATTKYVDELRGLEKRLARVQQSKNATEMLNTYVDVWGNYIPEIYGLAKALLVARASDEAAEAAWNDCMGDLRQGCREIVGALKKENNLAASWSAEKASDMMWTMLSFQTWEHLTIDCGWSVDQYVTQMQTTLRATFVKPPENEAQIITQYHHTNKSA